MINQQWLETFINLMNIGHFTKTAKHLNMTQPGVSQHIKKLEVQMGVSLIKRTGKSFELTNSGEALLKFGLNRINREKDFFKSLQADSVECGECNIGMSGTLACLLYPYFLERQIRFPDIVLNLEAAPNHLILEKITSNKHDFGIVTEPYKSTELSYSSVGYETLCLVLPTKYETKVVDYALLDELGFINHPDGFYYVDRVLSANFSESYTGVNNLKISGYINQINQILNPVSAGIGYTVLPISMIEQFKDQSSLFIIDLKNEVKEELYIVKKKHKELAKRFDWFINTIKEVLT